jgi:hypothetical protein
VPIIATPLVQAVRAGSAWGVVVLTGFVTIVVLVLLGRLLASMTSTAPTEPTRPHPDRATR